MDQQHVRPQPVARDRLERRVRRALELDRDRRLAPREPLAGPDVERRVRPPPVVDVELRGDVGVRLRARVDAGLLAVREHLLPLDPAAAVLAPDDRLRPRRVHRAQHLHLLVPHRVRREVDRRLHRGEREELQEVVLEDVPDHAGLLVVARAALDPHRLGDRDLDMVDHLAVPDRLEDAVREPQRHQVLDGLLAEVVVDPEDLVLGEPPLHGRTQLARRGEVVAERLLDDDAGPALALAPLADLAHHHRERLRRHGEVVEPVAAGPARLVELVQHLSHAVLAAVVGEVGRDVAHARSERLEHVGAERVAGELLHRLPHRSDELARRLLAARDADDGEPLRQEPAEGERVERRQQLALRQVARRAEHDERAGIRLAPDAQALRKRVRRLRHYRAATTRSFSAMPARSSSNESENFRTPSSSSVATTSS